jgi:hypothetical protein
MAIHPFLAGRAFDPDTIEEMSAAFESACASLGLNLVDDAATRLVAKTIIELAQRGVRGAPRLHAMAIKEFEPD